MKTLLVYAPVIHAGYQKLINVLNPERILVVSDEVANQFDKRRKDIRALHSLEIVRMLRTLHPSIVVQEFNGQNIFYEGETIHMPVEDISDDISSNFLVGRKIIWESVFLRYDSKKSKSPEEIIPDRVISKDDESVAPILTLLSEDAQKSPDWFRQVSAAVVKGGEVLSLCHNKHSPSDVVTYALGDPRSNSVKGMDTNVGKPAHAEPLACFLAGVEGTRGADLFVTTFPCPQCANFLQFTGLRSLCFVEGYSLVNGAEDLRGAGIEIIKVE